MPIKRRTVEEWVRRRVAAGKLAHLGIDDPDLVSFMASYVVWAPLPWQPSL